MSRNNGAKHVKWHETCKCKCRLDGTVCNNQQCCKKDKYRCDCKELIDKGICDKRSIRNSSIFECECDKLCGIGQHLDYENWKCTKKLIDKLVEQCSKNIDENDHIDYRNVFNSWTVHVVLFVFNNNWH